MCACVVLHYRLITIRPSVIVLISRPIFTLMMPLTYMMTNGKVFIISSICYISKTMIQLTFFIITRVITSYFGHIQL